MSTKMFHVFVGEDYGHVHRAARKFSDNVELTIEKYPTKYEKYVASFRNRSKIAVTTDSPLFLNECSPDEVTLVSIDDHGKPVETLFSDMPGIEQAMKVYHLGEFWLNYVEGGKETPLLTGTPRKGEA